MSVKRQPENTIIRSIWKPAIKIDKMQAEDLFTGTSERLPPSKKGEKTFRQIHKELGSEYPFILINNYVFDPNEIKYFEINSTSFLPYATFVFQLTKTDAFKSHGFPKDGDIMSVFIRSRNNALKPIRNDYIIKSISAGKGGNENRNGTCIIDAELFIPHLQDQILKSYRGTSYNTLLQIAKDLKLGFATNEKETADEQSWLCTNNTWEEFIQQIAAAAYKNTDSFYKCFIDVYYHLNFINMNNQIEGDDVMGAAILDTTIFNDRYLPDAGTVEASQTQTGKFLSNIPAIKNTNAFIRGFAVVNNSTQINQTFGYKQNIQFFDMKSLQLWNLYVDPKTTTNAENNKIILKGRLFPKAEEKREQLKSISEADEKEKEKSENEFWKTQNRTVWKGLQSKNVHDKYFYATVNNERNLMELEKMYIRVDVNRWNPNIYVGEKVPIIIVSQADLTKARLDAQATEDAEYVNNSPGNPPVIDQFYSGFYVINGMKIVWDSDNKNYEMMREKDPQYAAPAFFQTFIMTRREWPIPV